MSTWIIYAICSAFFAALVAVFGKIGVSGIDSTFAAMVRSVIIAIVLIGACFAFRIYDPAALSGKPFLFIVLAGISGALSWAFYFAALKVGNASAVAAVDKTSIMFILALSILFLGESLTWKTGLGALLVVIGAILFV